VIRASCIETPQGLELERMPRGWGPCMLPCTAITVRVVKAASPGLLIGELGVG
jgi:hypothetical protein